MPAQLKHGVIGAPGGKRNGAGRKPDWLIAQCQEIVEDSKLLEFLASVVKGEDVEQAVGDQGETIRIPPAVRDRLRAAEMLLDRAYGKAGQPIELNIQSELAPIPTRDLLEFFQALPGGTYIDTEVRA